MVSMTELRDEIKDLEKAYKELWCTWRDTKDRERIAQLFGKLAAHISFVKIAA